MEVVPYASAPRHVNPSAASQNSILNRRRPTFKNGVLATTLVVSAYRYFNNVQSFTSAFSPSNPLGEVSENLLDHPLTDLAALLRYVASALWWASVQIGWIHHDSRTVRWIRFFSSHWLGSILFRQAVYYILFSALSFVASRLCRWVLQSPFKILRLGSPRQKSLECSKMEKGLEKIAAELHGVNVALSTRQNEIQAPIPEKILFFKLPLCEVIFRPAVLVWTIVRAFGHLLYTIVDCTMELLFWPPELFWTFLKFGMALVFLPFRALFWVLGLGVFALTTNARDKGRVTQFLTTCPA